ncbi:MAG: hypothetical protein AB1625_10025 [Acidobacteriota bacterium]
MPSNAHLAEALFRLAESHPPGDLRLGLLRAAYAVFDHPRELDRQRQVPATIPLEALPTVSMLRAALSEDALAAVVQRLSGPHPVRHTHTREGYLTAAEVDAVLTEDGELDPAHLRGAVHWHTRASDGATTLEAMARACSRRGASWAVVADHTRGLACVIGLDGEGAAMQRRQIDAWNRRHGDETRLLAGLEVEILDDGRLDLPRTDRRGVLVIAAVHTELSERRDQTPRLLRALDEPGVWALAHPRGRLFARRGGIRASWERIFERASEAGVLIEINGFPRRQDPDSALLRLATECGCRFVLGSDAHHPRHLAFEATAVALAREAGVPRERIVNFDHVETVLAASEELGPE